MPWGPHLSQKGLVQPVEGTTIFSSPTAFSSTCMGRVHNSHFFSSYSTRLERPYLFWAWLCFEDRGSPD